MKQTCQSDSRTQLWQVVLVYDSPGWIQRWKANFTHHMKRSWKILFQLPCWLLWPKRSQKLKLWWLVRWISLIGQFCSPVHLFVTVHVSHLDFRVFRLSHASKNQTIVEDIRMAVETLEVSKCVMLYKPSNYLGFALPWTLGGFDRIYRSVAKSLWRTCSGRSKWLDRNTGNTYCRCVLLSIFQ